MSGLVAAWTVYDDQCERRDTPNGRMLPTAAATNAVMGLTGELAGRIGVTGTELLSFMQALRRGGWGRDRIVGALEMLTAAS